MTTPRPALAPMPDDSPTIEIDGMAESAAWWVAVFAEYQDALDDAALAVMDEATIYGPGPLTPHDLGTIITEAVERTAQNGGKVRTNALCILRERFPLGPRPNGILDVSKRHDKL